MGDALVVKIAKGLFSEIVWLGVGAAVGCFSTIAGVGLAMKRKPENPNIAYSVMLIWFTTPACAVLSGLVAAGCQGIFGVSELRKRLMVCAAFNALMAAGLIAYFPASLE